MTTLLQASIDGIAIGSLYALIALGYTMVYGVLRFINFAHSDVFMLGAWFSFLFASLLGFSGHDEANFFYAGLVVFSSISVCGFLGFLIERLAYRPLRNAPRINVLITAIGVSLFIENLAQLELFFGNRPRRMPTLVTDVELAHFLGVRIHSIDVLVILSAGVLMWVLERLVYSTKLGLAMRAVSMDGKTASLMGIDVNRVISTTFVIGSMLAAAAGFLSAMKFPSLNQPAHSTWILLGLKAFVAAVIGGIGNIRGAMLGGIVIGVVEIYSTTYLSSSLRDVYVFGILILVLLYRPEGLIGKATIEKV